MALLVIGATGLLGQEIVIQALEAGYTVKCMVRNLNKSLNLRVFGADLIYADLGLPETIPPTLRGIKILIDASTFRLNSTYHAERIDWYGKLVLLKSAKLAKIKRFIFFSATDLQYHPQIFLLNLKFQFERVLIKCGIPYTIFRISGFLQSFVGEYSRRILNENTIWISELEKEKNYFYIDVYAVAKLCLQSLILRSTSNKVFSLIDQKLKVKGELENLCKIVIGPLAEVLIVPLFLVQIANRLSNSIEATWNIRDLFSYFETQTTVKDKQTGNFYLNKIFRSKSQAFYDYSTYLRDYLDLIIFDLQKLHKD